MMSNIFTTIYHAFRVHHGLTLNEYVLCDTIYYLSTNPDSKVLGWCYKSRVNLAKDLGLSKQSILNLINSLIDKDFIIKDPETNFLKTSRKWNEVYRFTTGKDSLPPANFLDESGKDSLPNNNIYNNISKDIYNDDDLNKDLFGIKPKEKNKEKPTKESFTNFHFKQILVDKGAFTELVDDWITVRKTKKAACTKTSLNSFLKQVDISGKNINEVLEICITKNWIGFKADWISTQTKEENNNNISFD